VQPGGKGQPGLSLISRLALTGGRFALAAVASRLTLLRRFRCCDIQVAQARQHLLLQQFQ
jgi:hypothetical protein